MKFILNQVLTPRILFTMFIAGFAIHAICSYGWLFGLTFFGVYSIAVNYIKYKYTTETSTYFDLSESAYVEKIFDEESFTYLHTKITLVAIQIIIIYFLVTIFTYVVLATIGHHEWLILIMAILAIGVEQFGRSKGRKIIDYCFKNYISE